jgi:two-component system sensor histidine kinase EvgS
MIGFDMEHLQLLAARAGLTFEYLDGNNWVERMKKEGPPPVDLVTGLAATPGRERFFAYTEPYGHSPIVLIVRDNAPTNVTPGELGGTRLALTRGYDAMNNLILQAAPGAQPVYFDDDEAMLRAVQRGECFAAVDDVITTSYFIRARGLTNLRVGSVLAMPDEMTFGVRPDWPELVGILNKALASLTGAERLAIANRWIGVNLDTGQQWRKAFRMVSGIAGLVGLLLLFLSLHNRRLRREIEMRRRTQLELEATRDGLAAANASNEAILKIVAHDLRSPLTSIALSAEMMRLDATSAAGALESSRIMEAARRMGELISELLREHVSESPVSPAGPTDWAFIVRGSLRQAQPAARVKDITLRPEVTEAVAIGAEPGSLGHVTDNLIGNALKFSPPGSTVTVRLVALDRLARLEVADQGPGVPPEERAKIFAQGAVGSGRPSGGESSHGLGLWIVHRLVTEAGGRVWCEEAATGGARFIVELPCWTEHMRAKNPTA